MDKQRAAWISVISNTGLVVLKLSVGLSIFSVSVLSEALHSMMDLIASLIANYSVRRSVEPPDREHMYGHGKYENLSGVIEAMLIFIAAALIIYESLSKIINQSGIAEVDLGIAVMGISMVVNFFVSRKLSQVAREEDSIALEADSLHLSTDVLTSLGVFLGLILIRITGIQILDPIVAILVALLIIRAAWVLFKETSKGLLDEKLPPEEEMVIRNVLLEHSNHFVEFHALRTRKAGAHRFIDLHLLVNGDMTVRDSHDLADHLEREIERRLPHTSIIIHIEPDDREEAAPVLRRDRIV